MTGHLLLIVRQLTHLQRMSEYLAHSVQRCQQIFPVSNWRTLSLEQHEILAAFRVRFSEFQEHLGKTMRAIAIEEEVKVDRFGSVLAFMEKLGVLESAERWKIIRELRNAVNHEYEEDTDRLTQFFMEMVNATPELFDCHHKLLGFCRKAYGIKPE
ncbi:MAG: hypothetical protein NTX45_26850 [Proteobacteria bacterium]|nr:hypothetical protein [Pseudomonadota bacterium]